MCYSHDRIRYLFTRNRTNNTESKSTMQTGWELFARDHTNRAYSRDVINAAFI